MLKTVIILATSLLPPLPRLTEPIPPPPVKENVFKLTSAEQSIIDLTNQKRARYGLPALKMSQPLTESARQHAQWMAKAKSLTHTTKQATTTQT